MDGMESPGQLLQRTRRDQGVTIRQLSAITKIPARLLQALEEDDYQEIPGEVFVRGFLRNCAKELDLEPELLVDRFLIHTGQAPLGSKAGLASEQDNAYRTLSKKSRILQPSLLLIVLAIVLGLALSILIFGPPDSDDELTDSYPETSIESWQD